MGKTLFEKIWDRHLVASIDESTNLVFIDLHLVHEVTSPQAFDSWIRKMLFLQLCLNLKKIFLDYGLLVESIAV